MNKNIINKAVTQMCSEVQEYNKGGLNWRLLTDDCLMHEMAVCIFSSQMIFEVAERAALRIREEGLLKICENTSCHAEYVALISNALSRPVTITRNGAERQSLPRFKNRLATLLSTTVMRLKDDDMSLLNILSISTSPRQARETLINKISGFGPKQASLFLRRIGYCSDLAVLDTHVMDYLRITRGINPKHSMLSRLSSYETIEDKFKRIADEFGFSMGCVDLAIWITMRVAKRELKQWA